VLATGLSALYSALPRRLPDALNDDPSWFRISSEDDLPSIPELATFVSSLDFVEAVTQISHHSVAEHLLALVYMGFLVPVLGQALVQVSQIILYYRI